MDTYDNALRGLVGWSYALHSVSALGNSFCRPNIWNIATYKWQINDNLI